MYFVFFRKKQFYFLTWVKWRYRLLCLRKAFSNYQPSTAIITKKQCKFFLNFLSRFQSDIRTSFMVLLIKFWWIFIIILLIQIERKGSLNLQLFFSGFQMMGVTSMQYFWLNNLPSIEKIVSVTTKIHVK